MNELFQKLLEAEILTPETKAELEASFQKQLDEAVAVAKADATAAVTADLHEQWIKDRETLIEALDAKVTEFATEEISELHEDVERFRDLEAEYATKLIEAKAEMSKTLKNDIKQLIEKLDGFLEVRLTAELEELREDVAEVRKQEFGRDIFEAFVEEFKKHYAGGDSVEAKLSETEQRLADATAMLKEQKEKAEKLERSIKMEKVLSPLSGRSREVMEAILKATDTSMLEDAYKTYIGRVLKETAAPQAVEKTSEKEAPVLAEGKKEKVSGIVKTGDDKDVQKEQKTLTESEVVVPTVSADVKNRYRALAGL